MPWKAPESFIGVQNLHMGTWHVFSHSDASGRLITLCGFGANRRPLMERPLYEKDICPGCLRAGMEEAVSLRAKFPRLMRFVYWLRIRGKI